MRFPQLALAAVATVLASACQSTDAGFADGVDPSTWEQIYVVRHDQDSHTIDQSIVGSLMAHGYKASSGPDGAMPAEADVRVEYVDRWNWDVTMFMQSLDITFRSTSGAATLATANARRDSITRQKPEEVVWLLLDELFGKEAPRPVDPNQEEEDTNVF